MKGIFITLSDIMSVRGVQKSEASRIKRTIKDALGKKKHQEVTVREFCDYEGISEEEFRNAIRIIPASDK